MTFSFEINSLNNVSDENLIFNFLPNSINNISQGGKPGETLSLKDIDNNYLYDINNNKLFVRR